MKRSWLGNIAHGIGAAIPNELSKTEGWSNLASYIPVVGPAISAGWKAAGTLDKVATAYGDTEPGQRGGLGAAINSFNFGSSDPGRYGSPNSNNDLWNTIGGIGNMIPSGIGSSGNFSGGWSKYGSNNNFGIGNAGSGSMPINLDSLMNIFGSSSKEQSVPQQIPWRKRVQAIQPQNNYFNPSPSIVRVPMQYG